MHSSERIVSSIKNDPVIDSAVANLKSLSKEAYERASFITRQLTSLKKKLVTDSEPVWTSIMDQLKFKGALPQSWTHSSSDYLKYEEDDDAIVAIHECECKPCQLKKMLSSALS